MGAAERLRQSSLRASFTGALSAIALLAQAAALGQYFPGPGERWERRDAHAVGMDPGTLAEAVRFAQDHEVDWLRDVRAQIEKDVAEEPYPEILGETKPRGAPAGVILRYGYIVAEWGDVHRVDMTFSVAKSYLSTLVGIAVERGLIRDVNDPVAQYVRDGGFESERNRQVTWAMLLNMTSEWEGELWDKPDLADRRRGYHRTLEAPGAFWEYNDVRVNRLALSLLRVFNEPLPAVLKREVMDPIGASGTWLWMGYRNSWVDLNGARVQSVSGGSHWGGGMWISARDHARFGYLFLRSGNWAGRQVISADWVRLATTAAAIAPHYGFLWWLNTGRRIAPSAPETSFFALGSGGNMIWVDAKHDLVVVTRWLESGQLEPLAKLIQAAIVSE